MTPPVWNTAANPPTNIPEKRDCSKPKVKRGVCRTETARSGGVPESAAERRGTRRHSLDPQEVPEASEFVVGFRGVGERLLDDLPEHPPELPPPPDLWLFLLAQYPRDDGLD